MRYFRAVAESKGFREAARQLHVVQPALSQTVSDLERELGVRLLTRNSRSVRLTSEGEVFLKEAKEILAHADRSVELARGAARGEIGSLSVGFLGSATAFFFAPDHPRVPSALPWHSAHAARDGAGASDRRVPRRTTRRRVHPARPRDGQCLGLCSRAGFTPRVVNEADMMQTFLTLVEAGEGVALVPACVSNLRGSGVVLRPVEPDTVRIPLEMVWLAGRESPALGSFLGLVREHTATIRRMVPSGRRRRGPSTKLRGA